MLASDTPETALTFGDWELARHVSEWIEIAAIAAIAVTVLIAGVQMAQSFVAGDGGARAYVVFKTALSRGVLLGLDLLISADIIRTVTLDQTLENVAVLGLLVIVRTFLAWSLLLEAEGRWPWQPLRIDDTPA